MKPKNAIALLLALALLALLFWSLPPRGDCASSPPRAAGDGSLIWDCGDHEERVPVR